MEYWQVIVVDVVVDGNSAFRLLNLENFNIIIFMLCYVKNGGNRNFIKIFHIKSFFSVKKEQDDDGQLQHIYIY